ncbi:MAG: chemotaxis protein CheC [Bacteroidales bacterium]|nr:chemotaxis protein CheC [Bacteroidales bacterium]MCM1415543.1 chemotaxis protein CheC [bacterium]MCM1424376.1 chemotaxis protein CheC [bacterium]
MAQLAPLDQDKMAEVAQICMAHSATSLNALTRKVITVSPPSVKVVNSADIKNIVSAFGMGSVTVQIDYKDDFHGNNLLMFKENDVKVVMDLMMGGEGVAAPGELNEMHLSCVSEVMNQMMGSSAISLTEMIHKTVDINPPKATLVVDQAAVESIDYLPFPGNEVVIILSRFESAKLLKGIMIRIFPMQEVRFICDNFKVQ